MPTVNVSAWLKVLMLLMLLNMSACATHSPLPSSAQPKRPPPPADLMTPMDSGELWERSRALIRSSSELLESQNAD